MSDAHYTATSRARLDERIANGPAHLRSIMLAVRDGDCAFAVVTQGHHRFDIPTKRPAIVIIGDDLHNAQGPEGFHRKSLRRLLAQCRGVAIVSAEPMEKAYAAVAAAAVGFRTHAVLIETRIEQEPAWLAFVEEHEPDATVLVATIRPAGGVN